MSFTGDLRGESDRRGFGAVSTAAENGRSLIDDVGGIEGSCVSQGVTRASFGIGGASKAPADRAPAALSAHEGADEAPVETAAGRFEGRSSNADDSSSSARCRVMPAGGRKTPRRSSPRASSGGRVAEGMASGLLEGVEASDDRFEDSDAEALFRIGGGVMDGSRRRLFEGAANAGGAEGMPSVGSGASVGCQTARRADAAHALGDDSSVPMASSGGEAVGGMPSRAGSPSCPAGMDGSSSGTPRSAGTARRARASLSDANRAARGRAPANAAAGRMRIRMRGMHEKGVAGLRSMPGLIGEGRKVAGVAEASAGASGAASSAAGPATAIAACVVGCVMALLLIGLCLSVCFMGGREPATAVLPEQVEQWRAWVERACDEVFGDTEWATFVLCLMAAESGGDVNVGSVTGAREDVMQASEGAFGNVVKHGATKDVGVYDAAGNVVGSWPYSSVSANTALASIYAGVLEFRMNLRLWEGWVGDISPTDVGRLGLVAQGYNYGAHGWLSWCKRNNVTSYSVEDSIRYQRTLPAGLKGTANHGEKVISFYATAPADAGEVVARAYGKLGCPYVWGATGPDAFDCSGLVGYCLTGTTVRIGTTQTFMGWQRVTNPQPGDVCTTDSHCGIYIGGARMIHAPHSGDVVKIGPVQPGMVYVRYSG